MLSPVTLLKQLVPIAPGVQVGNVTLTATTATVELLSTRLPAACPCCATPTTRCSAPQKGSYALSVQASLRICKEPPA